MGRSQILKEENQTDDKLIVMENEFEDVQNLINFYKNIKRTFKKCRSL